ncbi:glycosyltransferase [Candidatus Marinimicrobia bacterium]|nr:glycosyltransferase [Candidatus Neomarinimicrobiota bacterium]
MSNKSEKYPIVSIVTPVYNSEKFLEEAINSVIYQSFKSWEMIIVDDCSSDKSVKIIKNIIKCNSKIKLIRNLTNEGAGVSRNKAIKIAKGRYIAFLDSDDIWHVDKLKIQINLMDEKKISFSHTSYGYLSEDGKPIKSTFRVSAYPVGYKNLLKRTEISCLTAVYNQEIIGKYYMTEHRRKQDYALWLEILKDGHQSFPIDIELAYYRQNSRSATSKKWKLIFIHFTFLIETQSMNFFSSIYYTLWWMYNGIIKYYLR